MSRTRSIVVAALAVALVAMVRPGHAGTAGTAADSGNEGRARTDVAGRAAERDPAERAAIAHGDWPAATIALWRRFQRESAREPVTPEGFVARLDVEIAHAPTPMRPLLLGIEARWLWQYYRSGAARTDGRTPGGATQASAMDVWDRTRVHDEIVLRFQRALAAPESLARIPVERFSDWIEPGTIPDRYRPTMLDFLAHEAIDFHYADDSPAHRAADAFVLRSDGMAFAPAEQFVQWRIDTPDSGSSIVRALRLCQMLLRVHAHDRDPGAYLDADRYRLRLVRIVGAGPDTDERYVAALTRSFERWPNDEMSAVTRFEAAQVLFDRGELERARTIAQVACERFPNSIGATFCRPLVQRCARTSLSITTAPVWNEPLPGIDVRYRGVRTVTFRIVADALPDTAWRRTPAPDARADAGDRTPVREWSVSLPGNGDLVARAVRVACPAGLAYGAYTLAACAGPQFRADAAPAVRVRFQVSDLAVVRDDGPSGARGLVVDARSGEPVAGAVVSAGRAVCTTDTEGRFHVDAIAPGLVIRRGRDALVSGGATAPGAGERLPVGPVAGAMLRADRPIYRPGETIRYFGVCYVADRDSNDYSVTPGREVDVVLRGPDGAELGRRHHTTDSWGALDGEIAVPATTLTGLANLVIDGAAAATTPVRIEDYRRPRFAVTLDPPARAARLDDSVTVAGHATAYTGAAIDHARVTWRVVREVSRPGWWSWRFWWRPQSAYPAQEIARGDTTCDAHGVFALRFVALPDPIVGRDEEPVFVYTMHADVTDAAGETRSCVRTLRVGYAALVASVQAADWQQGGVPVRIDVRTALVDGAPCRAAGVLRIERLVAPGPVARDDPPPVADGDAPMARDTAAAPPPPRAGVPATWATGARVFERAVAIDTSGVAHADAALEPGVYRAMFETRDPDGVRVTAVLPLRVLDRGATRYAVAEPWLVAARSWTVEAGGTWEMVWATGYSSGRAYIQIEHRGRVLHAFWTPRGATQAFVHQPVDATMRGGFTVRVAMVRDNRAYLLERHVDVPWSDRRLAIQWEHRTTRLAPGARETWTAVIRAADSTRARAQVAATLYDASLDAFGAVAWPRGFGVFHEDAATRHTWVPDREPVADRADLGGYFSGYPPDATYRRLRFDGLWLPGAPVSVAPMAPWRADARPPAPPVLPPGSCGAFGQVIGPDGHGAAFVNVIELRTKRGTMTDEGGWFRLNGLPAGRVQLRALQVGYDPLVQTVTLEPDHAARVNFRFTAARATKTLEETVVRGTRLMETKSSVTKQWLPVDHLSQAVATKAAVVTMSDGLHFRGGRSGEATFQVDGVEAGDPLYGSGAPSLSGDSPPIDLSAVLARRRLGTTAFFRPRMVTGADGALRLEFTVPEALTEWRLLVFAHGRDLSSAWYDGRAVTALDLMVQPDLPRYLREGDTIEVAVKVVNLSDAPQRGHVRLSFTDPATGESVDPALGEAGRDRQFDVAPHASGVYAWRLSVGAVPALLAYRVAASTGTQSDAEEGRLQVLPREVLVAEARPFALTGPGERTLDLPLRGDGREPVSLAIQVASHPVWAAIAALPVLLRGADVTSPALARRLLANALARAAFADHPGVRAVFERWRVPLAPDPAAEPGLESVLLDETPWAAAAGSLARGDAARRLAPAGLDAALSRDVHELDDRRRDDGRWAWCPGGDGDDAATITVLDALGRAARLGVRGADEVAVPALARLDARADGLVPVRPRDPLSLAAVRALYVRSAFAARPRPPALDTLLARAGRPGAAPADPVSRLRVAIALGRFGAGDAARRALREARDAMPPDSVATPEARALLVEALHEISNDDAAIVRARAAIARDALEGRDAARLAAAAYALLVPWPGEAGAGAIVEVALDGVPLRPDSIAPGIGAYAVRADAARLARSGAMRVTLRKRDAGTALGSACWSYRTAATAAGADTGSVLRVHPRLFRRVNGRTGPELVPIDGPVHVGDEVVMRIELRAGRGLDHVHLSDGRGSGLESVDALSAARSQDGLAYYVCPRAAATHFYIDRVPAGTYVLEDAWRVRQRGSYAAGLLQVDALGAPDVRAHSAMPLLRVE